MANIQISLVKFIEKYKFKIILSFLFLIGLFFGGSHYLCWNDIVENSAFKAGLVDYNIKTPQFFFQSKLNSFFYVLVDQLLRVGFSELSMAFFTSALLGGLSFFTLGYIGLHFYPSYWVIPAVIFTDYFLLYEFGVNYQIAIVNSKFPQGHIGLVTSLFILVYHSFKRTRFSAFFLGCACIFHLTLGAWAICGVLAFEVISKNFREYKVTLIPLCLGILSSVLFYSFTGIEGAGSYFDAKDKYFYDYLQHWDLHQQPYNILDKGIWVSIAILVSYLLIGTNRVLKVCFSSFFLIAMTHGFLGHSFTSFIPNIWWGLMPSRLLNFCLLFGTTFFFLNALKNKTAASSLTLIHFLIVFLNILYIGKGEILSTGDLNKYYNLIFSVYLSSFFILILALKINFLNRELLKTHFVLRAALGLIFIVVLGTQIFTAPRSFAFNYGELKYYRNDPDYKKIYKVASLLLTAPSLRQFQLVSGKPILVELDTIDDLLYNPEQIKSTSGYLLDLYGINFFHPQKDFRNDIELIDSWVKNNWEMRSPEEWRRLQVKYKFSHIIAPKDWKLNLNTFVRNENWTAFSLN